MKGGATVKSKRRYVKKDVAFRKFLEAHIVPKEYYADNNDLPTITYNDTRYFLDIIRGRIINVNNPNDIKFFSELPSEFAELIMLIKKVKEFKNDVAIDDDGVLLVYG
jgi:hypothetical protein